MAIELTGKVVQLLPEQTGQGKNGVWKRQDFIIETADQYPKKICFSGWGDKADIVSGLQPGQSVKVSFNPESREFNGKWYTDLRAWKIETGDQGSAPSGGSFPDLQQYSNFEPPVISDEASKDDLPF